jgi:hypothetical protein
MYGAGEMTASDFHALNAFKSENVEIRNRYECALARARRGHWLCRLTGRDDGLRNLGQRISQHRVCGQRPLGLQLVPIARIVGSEGRSGDFDSQFRPLQEQTRHRWYSVARARLQDIPLPPVALIRVGDDYYVRDGHHRLSVARAYGQQMIEAQVIEYELTPRLAPDTLTPAMRPAICAPRSTRPWTTWRPC